MLFFKILHAIAPFYQNLAFLNMPLFQDSGSFIEENDNVGLLY